LLKKTSASIRKTGGCRKQAAIVFFSLFSDLMRLGDLTHERCDLMTILNRAFSGTGIALFMEKQLIRVPVVPIVPTLEAMELR
jgi:hypothetical protein